MGCYNKYGTIAVVLIWRTNQAAIRGHLRISTTQNGTGEAHAGLEHGKIRIVGTRFGHSAVG